MKPEAIEVFTQPVLGGGVTKAVFILLPRSCEILMEKFVRSDEYGCPGSVLIHVAPHLHTLIFPAGVLKALFSLIYHALHADFGM